MKGIFPILKKFVDSKFYSFLWYAIVVYIVLRLVNRYIFQYPIWWEQTVTNYVIYLIIVIVPIKYIVNWYDDTKKNK